MENLTNNANNILSNEQSLDYINNQYNEVESEIAKELFKKKITMVSLGAFYVLLLIVSFTLLS